MNLYKDTYVFNDNVVSELISLCNEADIVYLQVFGSYTKEKSTGLFRDILKAFYNSTLALIK